MFRAGFFALKSTCFRILPYLGWASSVLGMGLFRTWDGLFGVQKIIVLDKDVEGY